MSKKVEAISGYVSTIGGNDITISVSLSTIGGFLSSISVYMSSISDSPKIGTSTDSGWSLTNQLFSFFEFFIDILTIRGYVSSTGGNDITISVSLSTIGGFLSSISVYMSSISDSPKIGTSTDSGWSLTYQLFSFFEFFISALCRI